MKKGTIITIAIIAVIIAAITFQLVRNKKKINEANKPKANTELALPVNFIAISEESVDQELVKTGTMIPFKEADINAVGSGKLLSVNFNLGSHVGKGAVLATIDNKQVSQNTRSLELQRDQAKRDLERAKRLHDADAGTITAVQNAQLQYDNLQTQLRNVSTNLTDFSVRAPISGVVTMKLKEPGEFVGPGAVLGQIADISSLKVVVNVSEDEIYTIQVGQSAKVTTDIYPGQEFPGKVTYVSSVADQSKNFSVEVTIANSSKFPLKAGTFGYVDFIKNSAEKMLLIPRTALLSGTANPMVYIITAENRSSLRQIVMGKELGDMIEVISGLNTGDRVITSGIINLKEGTLVSPNQSSISVKQ